mgnify:CR=1 FL=1
MVWIEESAGGRGRERAALAESGRLVSVDLVVDLDSLLGSTVARLRLGVLVCVQHGQECHASKVPLGQNISCSPARRASE